MTSTAGPNKPENVMQNLRVLLLSGALVASAAVAHAQDVDWKQIDAAFGRSPATVAGDVHR
jgi:hypothetical protein